MLPCMETYGHLAQRHIFDQQTILNAVVQIAIHLVHTAQGYVQQVCQHADHALTHHKVATIGIHQDWMFLMDVPQLSVQIPRQMAITGQPMGEM